MSPVSSALPPHNLNRQRLSLWRRALATALLAALSGTLLPPLAMPAPLSAEHSAIERVIRNQLAAFQEDDSDRAFGLASPSIQARFGTAANFMRMVVLGYPAVYRPRDVRFLKIVKLDGTLVQRVYLIGPEGKPYIAHYPMLRLPDGTWRIDGCVLTRVDAQNA